jgi:hypothetical protein
MMRRSFSVLLAPAILLLTPSIGTAQTTGDLVTAAPAIVQVAAPLPADAAPLAVEVSSSAQAAGATATGPLAESQAVALRARNAFAPVPAPRAPRDNTAQNRALMVVGAVGIVVGAVVGDDAGNIIMLGSAVIGLVGLYRWLN